MSSIHQEVLFAASPQRVYKALTDAGEFSALTGAPAEISDQPGGSFSCFGGMITGRHVELVPNERLVQAWRVANWPAGSYSITSFTLKPEGSGTKLTFDHSGFPEAERSHLESGWSARYWDPIKKHLD